MIEIMASGWYEEHVLSLKDLVLQYIDQFWGRQGKEAIDDSSKVNRDSFFSWRNELEYDVRYTCGQNAKHLMNARLASGLSG